MSPNECKSTASDESPLECALPPLEFLTEDYRGIAAKYVKTALPSSWHTC